MLVRTVASDNSQGAGPTGLTVEALGQSEAFLEFQDQVSRVAPIDRPVMLIGERGTGKELAASRLHFLSRRWQMPFVTLNCAALSPTLIEAELFGHEKGAFTGAQQQRRGRFESAAGGTLFLDEIGMIPMPVQEKILRVVEYGSFERVGGSVPVEVDARIIGATNADLPALAHQGRFKRDLLDRLSFEVLFLPPLRARQGDILFLAEHFARRMAYELGRDDVLKFSPAAIRALENHRWEGNVRELKNVVERAVYRSTATEIDKIAFNPFNSPYAPRSEFGNEIASPALTTSSVNEDPSGSQPEPPPASMPPNERRNSDPDPDFQALLQQPFKAAVRDLEITLVKRALEGARFNQKKAAVQLGLSYDQLRGLCRKYADDIK